MMHRTLAMILCAVIFGALTAHAAMGQLYINEIFWDAPTNPADATHEYIELRGRPCLSLANHYLIFVEAENNAGNTGGAGLIENIFDLGNATLGANGILTLRQKANPAAIFADYPVNPKATDLRNTGTGSGFGSGAGSTIGASNISNAGLSNGQIENGGWTAMLIRVDDPATNAPTLNVDLDMDNNGLDVATGREGWTIVDSIGVLSEGPEAEFGRTYGKMNFMFDVTENVPDFDPTDHIEPEANFEAITAWPEFEAEYVGRWGNSTGSLPEDWHLSNLTEDGASGFVLPGTGDFRVSALNHPPLDSSEWESSHGVAYGTPLTTTVGSPNYPLNLLTPTPGDFDGDGDVDHGDLVDQWMPRFECGDLMGADFLDWQRNLGTVATPPASTTISVVPEPAARGVFVIAVFGVLMMLRGRLHSTFA